MENMTRIVNVNGKSKVNSERWIRVKMSPRPHTITPSRKVKTHGDLIMIEQPGKVHSCPLDLGCDFCTGSHTCEALVSVTVQGQDLLFSIIHLPVLTSDSSLTFTILVTFFTNTYCYVVW